MEPDVIEETQFSIEDTENETGIAYFENDENRLKIYVQRLKLAVAVAVIRSTPPEMTPENYATYLNQRIKDDSYKWKTKCETLERELIVLTQKLETMNMKEKFNMPDMDVTLRKFSPQNFQYFNTCYILCSHIKLLFFMAKEKKWV